MLRAVGAALSGLSFFRKRIDVAANNLANMSTPGYKKQRVVVSQNEVGHPQADIVRVNTPGVPLPDPVEGQPRESSNVDPATEIVDMQSAVRGFQANLKTIQTEDEILRSLLDTKA